MWLIALATILAALLAGLVFKVYLDKTGSRKEITWPEYALCAAAICVVLVPLTSYAGFKISQNHALTFTEFWNGCEKAAIAQRIECSKDGPCQWEYSCDPYECNCSTDKDGNRSCSTCYHACPYVDYEMSYRVATTVGTVSIAEHRLPENPNAHRWDRWERVPESVIRRAGTGAPEHWLRAKARIDAGYPAPVTVQRSYPNYILATDKNILRQAGGDIERFQSARTLPEITSGVYAHYSADKVHFVGHSPTNLLDWQRALMFLNQEAGMKRQADVHVVVTNHPMIHGSPDAYLMALKSHWQNREVFGQNALPKNTLLVVIGTQDGQTVEWARASTGMPLGNEHLRQAILSGLKGKPLTPEALLAQVTPVDPSRQMYRLDPGNGALERLILGLDNPATRFERVSMSGGKPDDVGTGFLYLKNEIQPGPWAKFFTFLVAFILSLIAFAVAAEQGYRRGGTWYAQPRAFGRAPATGSGSPWARKSPRERVRF